MRKLCLNNACVLYSLRILIVNILALPLTHRTKKLGKNVAFATPCVHAIIHQHKIRCLLVIFS